MNMKKTVKILFGTEENYKKLHKKYVKMVEKAQKDIPFFISNISTICMLYDRLYILFEKRNKLYKMMNGEYADKYDAVLFGDKPKKT